MSWSKGGVWLGDGGWSVPGTVLWTPALLPGLIAWYKADVGVFSDAGVTAAVNSGTVQQWNDNSGLGNHLTRSSPANKPTFLTAGLNSKKTVSFSAASNQNLLTAASSVAMGTGGAGSAFAVLQMNSATGVSGGVVSYETASGNDYDTAGNARFLARDGANNNISSFRNSGTGPVSAISLATTVHVGTIYNASANTLWVNGSSGGFGGVSPNWATPGSICIGSAQTSGQVAQTGGGWDGPVSEVIIGNADWTAYGAQIEAYFSSRW
jgi:hypothetical protein